MLTFPRPCLAATAGGAEEDVHVFGDVISFQLRDRVEGLGMRERRAGGPERGRNKDFGTPSVLSISIYVMLGWVYDTVFRWSLEAASRETPHDALVQIDSGIWRSGSHTPAVCVCMCVCVCVCVCMYIYTYIRTYIHTYTHTYAQSYKHTCMHT